jgi:hypothetical protein
MTTTLTRPSAVWQPYFRRLTVRTLQWTLIVTTAFAAGQYVPLLFGLTGLAGLAVGTPVAMAAGILTHAAAAGRQRWAIVLTALVWTSWLIVGYSVTGIHNLVTLAEALGFTATVVAISIGSVDARRQMWTKRR